MCLRWGFSFALQLLHSYKSKITLTPYLWGSVRSLWRPQRLGCQGPVPKPVCTPLGDVMKSLNPALQVPRSIINPLTVGTIRGSKWHKVSKWFDVETGMYTSRNRMSGIVSATVLYICMKNQRLLFWREQKKLKNILIHILQKVFEEHWFDGSTFFTPLFT